MVAPWPRAGATHASPQVPALVLTGARLLDPVSGRYLPAAAVVIERDRITAVHPKAPKALPQGAVLRDLAGMTLVPGLIDFHARAVPSGTLEPGFFALLSLAHGVTTVRAPATIESWLIARRERIRAGEIVAPRLWLTGRPLGEATAGTPYAAGSSADMLAVTRDDVANAIARQKEAGVDWVRISATAGPEVLRAAVAAARSAGLKISAEAVRVPVAEAAELGVDAVDGTGLLVRSIDVLSRAAPAGHADPAQVVDAAWARATDADINAAIVAMRRRHVALVPLLTMDAARALPAETAKDPQLDRLPMSLRTAIRSDATRRAAGDAAASRKAHDRRTAFVSAFAKQGGRILAGSGTGERGYPLPGAAIHAELARLTAAGLTPAEAIRAATSNAADALGAATSLGQIRAGYRADLIAVSGDPLQRIEDLSRITLIVRGGEVLERSELLEQAARATGTVK